MIDRDKKSNHRSFFTWRLLSILITVIYISSAGIAVLCQRMSPQSYGGRGPNITPADILAYLLMLPGTIPFELVSDFDQQSNLEAAVAIGITALFVFGISTGFFRILRFFFRIREKRNS